MAQGDNTNSQSAGFDDVCHSRNNLTDRTELRVQIPIRLARVIDAEVMARGGEAANVYRATVVTELLTAWTEKKLHDASMLMRIVGSNPTGSEGGN